jgi:hypothetical protein
VGPGAYYFRGVMPSVFNAAMGKLIVDACKGPFPHGVQPVRSITINASVAHTVRIGCACVFCFCGLTAAEHGDATHSWCISTAGRRRNCLASGFCWLFHHSSLRCVL